MPRKKPDIEVQSGETPYEQKRTPAATPEPFGASDGGRPSLFVVQKHAARRTHWDFRLELGGILKSWAVPHGPSGDPAEKRLAVEVEDHPVDYADFEGVIPDGNYGAGAVIVWDRGRWIPLEDPVAGLEKGKLVFELRGYKMRGTWNLVRTKSRGGEPSKEWLLIKRADAAASATPFAPHSVLSGLTVEELSEGPQRAAEVHAELERLGAPRRTVRASEIELQLAERRERPFTGPGWFFELKYDGYRALAVRESGRARLLYRRGSDATDLYPDLARALRALPFEELILDGEICVLDGEGRPSFQRLQQRSMLQRAADIARATVELPAVLYLFDLLAVDGFDVRPLPLRARKELLRRVVPRVGPLRFADHVEAQGDALFEKVRAVGVEGIVAKQADSAYRGGRRPDWLKIRLERTADFAVVGFTDPRGSRAGFGGLHLACWEPLPDGTRRLRYAGRVGSGFSDEELRSLRADLERDRCKKPPCEGAVPKVGRTNSWVEPRRVVEVRFMDWTDDGVLRQPRLVRLRDDKRVDECEVHGAALEVPAPPPRWQQPVAQNPAISSLARKVSLSNLDKVFWPDEGYTKGDLIEYYRAVAPYLIPYLRDRPLVLTRYPDGIAGKSFFQKDAPASTPGWVRTERIFSPGAEREVDHFVVEDVESLLYVANLGAIPLHLWSSRLHALDRPDWCLVDLDPKGAPFAQVIEVALAVRALCEHMGLPSYLKTSGQAGLHILVPLGGRCTHVEARTLGQLLARVVADAHPAIATIERVIAERKGRVYLDYLQNGQGKVMASPLCARPVAGATVSMPLDWSQVGPKLDPRAFTIKTAARILDERGVDPMARVLVDAPDLHAALERLATRIAR